MYATLDLSVVCTWLLNNLVTEGSNLMASWTKYTKQYSATTDKVGVWYIFIQLS